MSETSEQHGFQFPGTFEVTAMGDAPELEAIVLSELVAAGVEPDLASVRQRNSSGGRYLSVSVSFPCDTRARYEAIHVRLRAHPAIRWTL